LMTRKLLQLAPNPRLETSSLGIVGACHLVTSIEFPLLVLIKTGRRACNQDLGPQEPFLFEKNPVVSAICQIA
jgi:hypothetical protein